MPKVKMAKVIKAKVAVICLNAGGEEDVFLAEFETPAEQYADSEHLETAVEMARDRHYEGPFFAVDELALPALIERLQSVQQEIERKTAVRRKPHGKR